MAAVPDPRTLLLPDPDEVPSVLKDTFIPSVAAGIATVAVYAANAGTRRPRYSGIYWYPIAALIGYGVTSYFQEKHYQFNSEKDAILRHYIELHPEDFPMPDQDSSWTATLRLSL
ncbi:NADH dehydrogenase (ubiquinone) B14.5 B subunit isoform X2 [Rhodnius prolixus]|uniref:NADH dehydrogenase (ubiquinone) B14.5 B subunit isoform X2 n=1 Tax=Rhodnius prolixus TaxID=13249 RepID=UPI003D18D3B2